MAPHLPEGVKTRTEQLLEELCAISSASGDAAGLRRVAERLRAELVAHGLGVEIQEVPGEGGPLPLLLARGPAAGGSCLLLVGHMDTVLPARPPRREGDHLLASGALDMKGGLAAFLGALHLLQARGVAYPADLLLAVVPDEEVSGAISGRTMGELGRSARAVLVLEPGEARGEAETLVAGRRGLREWRLDVRGRASHSGLAFWEGRSALAAAARFAVEAAALSRPGPGVTVNVARMVAGAADFVSHLAARGQLLGTTRQLNVVPDRAVVEGEVRFLRLAEGEEVLARLEEIAREVARAYGVTAGLVARPAVAPVDPQGPGRGLVARAVALAARRGWTLEVEEDRGGISFPNFLPAGASVPVLDGLGPVGSGMHTEEERVSLTSLARRVELLADLLAGL